MTTYIFLPWPVLDSAYLRLCSVAPDQFPGIPLPPSSPSPFASPPTPCARQARIIAGAGTHCYQEITYQMVLLSYAARRGCREGVFSILCSADLAVRHHTEIMPRYPAWFAPNMSRDANELMGPRYSPHRSNVNALAILGTEKLHGL